MDRVLPAIHPQRETSPSGNHPNVYPQPPPNRAPPPAPHGDVLGERTGQDVASQYTSQAWKNRPPSRIPPIPTGNFEASDEGEHYKPLSSNIQPRYAEIDQRRASRTLEDNHIQNHSSSASRQGSPPTVPHLPETYTPPLRTSSASPRSLDYRRPRAESLALPHSPAEYNAYRSVSTPLESRPTSQVYYSDGDNEMNMLREKRTSFLALFGTPKPSEGENEAELRAWAFQSGMEMEYNLGFLMKGEKVPELWDSSDDANLYVYFYPLGSGLGPQVKCPASVIQSSQALLDLVQESPRGRHRAKSFDGRASLSIEDATRNLAVRNPPSPPFSPQLTSYEPTSPSDGSESIQSFPTNYPPRELHLYLPVGVKNILGQSGEKINQTAEEKYGRQRLVDVRNLFAFLTGQAVVGTNRTRSIFRCFLAISQLLAEFGFSDNGGTSFGPRADQCFEYYLKEYKLADVRTSREKTLEGLILGEAMKSGALYNEAFAHAVGKYEDVKSKRSPIEDELSLKTQQSVERGHLQLKGYKSYGEERLNDFEFPSVFSGIANSTSRDEAKLVRFKNWRSNFMALRKAVLAYYKQTHGSWPPKASSKKNSFVEGGLNRLVLKGLYQDFGTLYSFLVDRQNVTTRVIGAEMKDSENEQPAISILRKLLGEFDKSTTWETPAIPLDVPYLPTLLSADPHVARLFPQEQEKETNKRKLKDHEIDAVLEKGHNNVDGPKPYKTDFMTMYRLFEKKEARGKTTRELQEQRIGHWIFVYCVLQVLPLLVSDASGLQFTDGVEYFLSATPPESLPWIARSTISAQYQTISGHIGHAPAYQLKYGINSIYERSHCWERARVWLSPDVPEVDGDMDDLPLQGQLSPLAPPPSFMAEGGFRARRSVGGAEGFLGVGEEERSGSRGRLTNRMSLALGLESMPRIEPGEESAVSRASAAVRTPPDRGATFEEILAGTDLGGDGRKKGKKEKK